MGSESRLDTQKLVDDIDLALSFGTTGRDALPNLLKRCKAALESPHSETADSKDAARYRWLKSLMKEDAEGWTFPGIKGAPSIETVDQVIDATLESQ